MKSAVNSTEVWHAVGRELAHLPWWAWPIIVFGLFGRALDQPRRRRRPVPNRAFRKSGR